MITRSPASAHAAALRSWITPLAALEGVVLLAAVLQHRQGFCWLVRTLHDTTYESWGIVALLLLAPALLRPPPRRAAPSVPHLVGVAALALLDLATAPLRLHVLAALLGILRLHLGAVAFRVYAGRWFGQPQLWLGLATLPVVFWANVIVGHPLQQLVTGIAARGLALYGLPATADGTLIHLPAATIAVDATCSGLKLLYSGLLFGLLAAPRRAAGSLRGARLVFWGALAVLLLGANVVRVMSLVMAQLHLGRPLGEAAHQAVGLAAFALVCAACLALLRRIAPPAAAPAGAGGQA